jgi:hypothetical protein
MAADMHWISGALSMPRFAPYLARTSGDVDDALRLYWWNVEISGAFYTALHLLEVSLRNALHAHLTQLLRRGDWWTVAGLQENGLRTVTGATAKVRQRKALVSTDDVVAELTFGFWVSLISRKHDQTLWVPGLHRAFPHYRGSRSALHEALHTIMLFRNRIMHHEPIHHRHLDADHGTIRTLLGYLSPDLARRVEPRDRVPAVLLTRPAVSAG